MNFTSNLSFNFLSETEACRLFNVLYPEAKSDTRATTSINLAGKSLSLKIESKDCNALRSSLNSYARWMRLYEEIGGVN